MKTTPPSLAVIVSLVALLGAPTAHAGAGHGPEHGGVVREMHDMSYELVARPDSLTLHLGDHGRKIATGGVKAEAVIYGKSGKIPVALAPAGDNRMQAKGQFPVGVGVRVLLTVTLPGKAPVSMSFGLK